MVAAEALASGRYCHLTRPGCPPLLEASPGWPAALLPAALLSDSPSAFQALGALLAALVPAACWLWLRRRLPPGAALLAALLCGTSPLLLSQSGAPMSEAPYLLLSLALLAAADAGRAPAAGCLWAWAVLMRPAGLSLAPALLARPLLGRRPREALLLAAPAAAASAAWIAWSKAAAGSVQEAAELSSAYSSSLSRLLSVAADNARAYAALLGGQHLPPALADGPAAAALGAALLCAAALGTARLLRRDPGERGAWALAGAAAMHAVWPWHYERYLIPLLPLLWRSAAEGLGRAAAPALGLLLAAQLGAQVLPRLGRPGPWDEPEHSASYAWLSARPGTWLLASPSPLRDGWWTSRPAVPLLEAEGARELSARLKARGVRFVLMPAGLDLGLSDEARSPIARALSRARSQLADPSAFRLVFRDPRSGAGIHEPL